MSSYSCDHKEKLKSVVQLNTEKIQTIKTQRRRVPFLVIPFVELSPNINDKLKRKSMCKESY